MKPVHAPSSRSLMDAQAVEKSKLAQLQVFNWDPIIIIIIAAVDVNRCP
jgi:hypothetical protein